MGRRHVFLRIVLPPGDQIADLPALDRNDVEQFAAFDEHAAALSRRNYDFAQWRCCGGAHADRALSRSLAVSAAGG